MATPGQRRRGFMSSTPLLRSSEPQRCRRFHETISSRASRHSQNTITTTGIRTGMGSSDGMLMISGTRPRGPRKNDPRRDHHREAHAPQVTRDPLRSVNAAGADHADVADGRQAIAHDGEDERRRCVRAAAHAPRECQQARTETPRPRATVSIRPGCRLLAHSQHRGRRRSRRSPVRRRHSSGCPSGRSAP